MSQNAVNTKNQTQLKQEAQDRLMHRIIQELTAIGEDGTEQCDVEALTPHLIRQIQRVERLFGYDEGSWGITQAAR